MNALLAIVEELEEAFDKDIYPEQKKEDFDAPDDREYSVTVTAKQWRALTRAVTVANGTLCMKCGGNGTEAKPFQLACAAGHAGPFRDEHGFYEKRYLTEVGS